MKILNRGRTLADKRPGVTSQNYSGAFRVKRSRWRPSNSVKNRQVEYNVILRNNVYKEVSRPGPRH